MTPDLSMTRRKALGAAATLPLVATLGAGASQAAAPSLGPAVPPFYRFTMGAFEVTTLLAATNPMENPQNIFGQNVSAEAFSEVSSANFLPADIVQFFFTPTVVNTGETLILFDTGLSAQGTLGALEAAGYSADQIDIVVITHMHGDHIGGLRTGETDTYPNARYVTGQVEYDHWASAGNAGFDAKVRPLADKMSFIGDDASVTPGITSVAAFGHTPGHMGYMLESEGKQLSLMADLANHYVWSLAYPDWEVRFDMDKSDAAAARRRLLGMLATEKMPMIGYHMPFPALGYVETRGDGFHYVPSSYQMML